MMNFKISKIYLRTFTFVANARVTSKTVKVSLSIVIFISAQLTTKETAIFSMKNKRNRTFREDP